MFRWPCGFIDKIASVGANKIVTIKEGAGKVAERDLARCEDSPRQILKRHKTPCRGVLNSKNLKDLPALEKSHEKEFTNCFAIRVRASRAQ
jgi:hypothetical protein